MEPSPAIPAATLVTVRERDGGPPELLMVERSEGMAFAGGALVFPGGRIDEADRALGGGDELGAAKVAAIRETLEETAIPTGIAPVPSAELALELQTALLAERDFGDLLGKHGLSLDPDALTQFARWVPKFHATRRFDTLFFLARLPGADRMPNFVEGECSGAFWISAGDALDREKRGDARLIFPTRRNLERLALHPDYGAMLADARVHPTDPISPWVEEVDGENFITIPEGIGYPVTRERLDGLWRG
ncbi:MAG TPA: NUDIX domain-containing protein [Sphingomicrobium sp.]|nr:NUDIX domain-containing protein [Sphingomicrobium sp.]